MSILRSLIILFLLGASANVWGTTTISQNVTIVIEPSGGGGSPATFTYNLSSCTPNNGASSANCTASGVGSLVGAPGTLWTGAPVCNSSPSNANLTQTDNALRQFNREAQKHSRPPDVNNTYTYAGGTQVAHGDGDGNAYPDAAVTNQIVLFLPTCASPSFIAYSYNRFTNEIPNLTVTGPGSGQLVMQNWACNSSPFATPCPEGVYYSSESIHKNGDYFGDAFYGVLSTDFTPPSSPAINNYGSLVSG